MRILAIADSYPPYHSGGYELRCRDVLMNLRSRGHQIRIITTHPPRNSSNSYHEDQNIIRVLHRKSDATIVIKQILYDICDLRVIEAEVRRFSPDIVYLWNISNLSNTFLPYFSDKGIKIIYDEGGTGLNYWFRIHKRGIYFYKNEQDHILKSTAKRVIYKIANLISFSLIKPEWKWPSKMRIYFNSHSAVNHALNQGIPIDGVDVIHSGIEICRFPFLPRERIEDPIHIILPSRIKPPKGTIDAVDLAKKLINQKHSVRIRLIGEIQSKEYFNEVKSYIYESGLSHAFEHSPLIPQEELALRYQESDVCFFPSYFESGFSRIPLEAMASGCLVISYGNEGSSEVIHHQTTGFIIQQGDVQSAANIIQSMVDNSSAYRQIIRRARSFVENNHTMDKYIDHIESLLESSINESQ